MLYIKLGWMYILAMFTAIVIYPTLHEVGHFLAALAVGADIVEISIFPFPHVSMFVDAQNALGQAAIGMCGMMFPMICLIFRPRRFVSIVVVGTIMFVNALAWLLSGVAIVANRCGVCWKNEDVITAIQNIKGAETGVFFFCLIALLINIYALFKKKTVCHIMSYF